MTLKSKVMRAPGTQAPRRLRAPAAERARRPRSEDARPRPQDAAAGRRRRAPLVLDATIEADRGPLPEEVFDRVTGPYGAPRGQGEAP